MITQFRSSASSSDTLKARKEHLAALLKIVDIKTGKTTTVQALTINLIRDEMSYVESKLKDGHNNKLVSFNTIQIGS